MALRRTGYTSADETTGGRGLSLRTSLAVYPPTNSYIAEQPLTLFLSFA